MKIERDVILYYFDRSADLLNGALVFIYSFKRKLFKLYIAIKVLYTEGGSGKYAIYIHCFKAPSKV